MDIKINAPGSLLVGFKLEPGLKTNNIIKETQGLFENSKCDLVVANSVDNGYQGYIVDKSKQILFKANSKKEIARGLVKIIRKIFL